MGRYDCDGKKVGSLLETGELSELMVPDGARSELVSAGPGTPSLKGHH